MRVNPPFFKLTVGIPRHFIIMDNYLVVSIEDVGKLCVFSRKEDGSLEMVSAYNVARNMSFSKESLFMMQAV